MNQGEERNHLYRYYVHSKETEFEYFIHFFIIESFFLLLLSEKSNSIDEIIFSYSVLIDTLKSTNIQINRKEFGLTCIVKKSLYSYWYFFHSVYTRTAPLIDLIQPLQSFVRKHRQLISERPEMNPSPTEIYSMSSLFHFHPELL